MRIENTLEHLTEPRSPIDLGLYAILPTFQTRDRWEMNEVFLRKIVFVDPDTQHCVRALSLPRPTRYNG